MDRRLGALAGILGFAWWRSRRKPAVVAPPDPADELRAKLAEAREADDRDALESEKPIDEASDPDVRRREVHDRARAAIDELQQHGE